MCFILMYKKYKNKTGQRTPQWHHCQFVIEKEGEKERQILSAMFSPTNTVLGRERNSLMGHGLLLEHLKHITDVDVSLQMGKTDSRWQET